jgi:putative transcriptional regulator
MLTNCWSEFSRTSHGGPGRYDTLMKDKSTRLPVADRIRKGLEQAIRHAKGEITLKTTTLEMPDKPPEVNAEVLTKLRLKNGMSQSVFAQVLNVSTKKVQSWEQGQRKPSQAALRLIQVFRQDPSALLEIVGMSGPSAKACR